jgi:CheY-like chemotaxis protein
MKSRILIVDDDDIMRQLFRFVLEREGYEVAEAASGSKYWPGPSPLSRT